MDRLLILPSVLCQKNVVVFLTKFRRAYIVATRVKILRIDGAKNCRGCGTLKPLSEFNREKRVNDGRSSKCKVCLKYGRPALYRKPGWTEEEKRTRDAERQRNKRRDNPVEMRSYGRLARAKRRARENEASGSFTKGDILNLFKMQKGKCAYFKTCGQKLGDKYHIDHIVPLTKGGSNWPRNLQLTCIRCNCSKGWKDPIDFAQQMGSLL
jgi:5-methylcytosine-specific restriction endonuclease McrA